MYDIVPYAKDKNLPVKRGVFAPVAVLTEITIDIKLYCAGLLPGPAAETSVKAVYEPARPDDKGKIIDIYV